MNRKTVILLAAWFVFAAVAAPCSGAGDGLHELREQEKTLRKRVASLKQEQDYLLFLKRMYESDSKYLILDMKKKKVQLRYKNRLLKNFDLRSVSPDFARKVAPGTSSVTKKIEGAKERHALVFDNAYVLRWKLSEVPRPESSLPSILVAKKDLLSFYFTSGTGMAAFVIK